MINFSLLFEIAARNAADMAIDGGSRLCLSQGYALVLRLQSQLIHPCVPPMPPKSRTRLSSYLLYLPHSLKVWKLFKGTSGKIADLRRDYDRGDLLEGVADPNPIKQFETWLNDAISAKFTDPTGMTVATVDERGMPATRTVLLKDFDERGFVFYTNYESRKGKHLKTNPQASLLLAWYPLERQIEVRGRVERVSTAQSEDYFQTRPIDSQLGAWASKQSTVIENREALEKRIEDLMAEYRGRTIPKPPFWGGFRVIPETIEFWQGRPSRLHDRLRYTSKPDGTWKIERLSP